jgi:uncharacterized protein
MLSFAEFSWAQLAWIALGGFTGGIVNGLTGFGTSVSAMPLWLQAVPPPVAAQLGAAGGIAGQLLTFRAIWHAIDWRNLVPMLAAGLVGIPFGAMCLALIEPRLFKQIVGVTLIVYAAGMLVAGDRLRLAPRGRGAEMVVGFIGGFMGGLAGMSGPAPTIWAALQGWTKERRRGVFQAFNFVILSAMLIAHALTGLIPECLLAAALVALPGTFAGVAIGRRLYAHLDDKGFDRVVLALLGVGGVLQLTIGR